MNNDENEELQGLGGFAARGRQHARNRVARNNGQEWRGAGAAAARPHFGPREGLQNAPRGRQPHRRGGGQQNAPRGHNQRFDQGFNALGGEPHEYRPRQNQEPGNYNPVRRQYDHQNNRNERAGYGAGGDGRRNDRDDHPRAARNERCMGFRALEEITRSNTNDIIVQINQNKSAFLNLLESNDKGDIFVLIIETITKISQSSFDELKLKLLLEICNSRLIRNLCNYLLELPYVENKTRNHLYWRDQTSFWRNFVEFCECIINISPSTALLKCRSLIEATSKCCLDGLRERHNFTLPEEYTTKLSNLRERLTICEKEDKQKLQSQQNRYDAVAEELEPPDDFRLLSVMPSREDLLEQRPFLRPNIVRGSYRDTDHYLDVQFRLLREDCFGPLREGITQFIENPTNNKYDNIRVYQNVKFIAPYISKNKIGDTVQLDDKTIRRLKRINWAHSKRFIFGSLLLFTKDCRSFLTATILEREIKLLNQGRIPISIINKDMAVDIYKDDSFFTMIESEVYFEPYFHVLKALQDPKFPEHLAMKKYIVSVDPEPNPPAYLSPESVYSVQTEYSAKTKFRVLSDVTWPSKEELGLNESQYFAYKLALTHEFAVIQGPPGTGKTFLGVKVAKTLLENINSVSCIMLVICFTNHALDQFLENILPVTQSIVRIGGQSRCEAMESLNLTNLRKNAKVKFDSKRLFFDQRNNLNLAIRDLKLAQERLDILNNGIISYECLKDHVPEIQSLGQYYTINRNDVTIDPLKHWLFENRQYEDINTIVTNENLEEQNNPINDLAENVDEDIERIEFILDEFEEIDVNPLGDNEPIKTCFLVADAEKKIKTLISLYSKTIDKQKKLEVQEEIVDLKSRINLFHEMSTNQKNETRLRISNRTNFGVVSTIQRWTVYFKWADIIINKLRRQLIPLQEALESANTAYEEARMMMDLNILKGVKVVGMTTSGAARLRKLLQALAPTIVIVEEAAEVLEQHIVTSLTKHCQHLILIGDHQQLRPSAAHIKLARHFNIEISLFERMITNGIHSRRLSVQHRMRPELAALITPHIYTDLANHPSVEYFPKVRGTTDNLFFFNHNYKEENVEDSSSRSNHLEADMTLSLANYLMQQDYEPGDVTILAAYSGQMFYMRTQRDKYAYLSKIKITVVDNYQGEESKIILLSLVRNNDQNKIGFLGTENRVCVALSRAREGFFIFGNINILKSNSKLWTKIATTLEDNASLGPTLLLKCENHPAQITMVSTPKDFEKVPEGGCLLKCEFNLPCGHRCPLVCHGYDRGHVQIKCHLKCERIICELNHVCPLICHQKCKPCKRLVEKTLPCGHRMQVLCYQDPEDTSIKCPAKVTVTLPKCGHEVEKRCHMKIELVECPVRCVYRVEKCGHECRRKCHVNDDPYHEKYLCVKPCANPKKGCTANLIGDRGDHQCQKKCYETCDDCSIEVMKKLKNCKHSKRMPCSENVDDVVCREKCSRTMSCGHFCKKKCHEPCGDCTQKVEKIIPDCNHKVKVMCKTPVTRELCKEKCERLLACGHMCTRLCGQLCDPAYCTQLIQRKFVSPCGHKVELPCNVIRDVKPEVLLQHCNMPCLQLLACEHTCAGSCARCYQGRLHAPCKEICHQVNVCGHQCTEPCNQACPPCSKICDIKCPHSRCNKICGAPCKPCQETCNRRCLHGLCTNRCGEPCSRAPCDEACPLTLSCGHRCRGLCGEPCPNICNVCRPDDFPRDFLGDEFDDDVKFVQLQDCTHVLDVENMDNLMTGDQATVSIRSCPFCRTPIINTSRYKDIVNNMFRNQINHVKERVYGNNDQIKLKKGELYIKILEFNETYGEIFEAIPSFHDAILHLHKIVKTQKKVSLLQVEMQFQYLEILDLIGECYRKYEDAGTTILQKEISNHIKLLCSTLKEERKISQQFQSDIGNEIKRMNSIIQLAQIQSHPSYSPSKSIPKVMQAMEAATREVFSCSVFNQNKTLVALKHLAETVKVSGIVTKEERDLIVKAIGSKSGSWYKCPNGHFYCISHCGGAMQISKCADCGAPIGGQSHALLPSNAHAGEVDNSRVSAWPSTYNNMANFQF